MAILKGLLGNSSKDREIAEDMRAILASSRASASAIRP